MTSNSDQNDASAPGNSKNAFEHMMRGFSGALHNNDFVGALSHARACARIAAVTKDENQDSGAREAFGAIILAGAARFEALALHCGNIISEHYDLSRTMYDASHELSTLVQQGSKNIPAWLAVTTENYASLLYEKVSEGFENPAHDITTSSERLFAIFAIFDPMVEYARGLMRSPNNFGLSPEAKFAAAGTAMQNCGSELHWILGSNWAKALWYTKRSLELVAIDPPADRPGPTEAPRRAMAPLLQPAVDSMVKLIDALNAQGYRDSKRLLKSINNCFESLLLAR